MDIEGLDWEKAEVQRLKADLHRVSMEREQCVARETELVDSESRTQRLGRVFQRNSWDFGGFPRLFGVIRAWKMATEQVSITFRS